MSLYLSGGAPRGHDHPRVVAAQQLRTNTGELVELMIKHPGLAAQSKINDQLMTLLETMRIHDSEASK